MTNFSTYKYDAVLQHDDVVGLRAMGVPAGCATPLLAHAIYRHTHAFACMDYLLRSQEILVADIPTYQLTPLFYYEEQEACRHNKLRVVKELLARGCQFSEYALYNTHGNPKGPRGVFKPLLELLLDLPDTAWKSGKKTNRIPFLVSRIMRSDEPTYYLDLLHKFAQRHPREELRELMNLTPVGVFRNPLQTISTTYVQQYVTNELSRQDMPLAIHVAKVLMEYGADPFHDPRLLSAERRENPKLAHFMESYVHQKQARQVLHDLLRVEKGLHVALPYDVLVHTCTRHMQNDNPYNQAFVQRLSQKYYQKA